MGGGQGWFAASDTPMTSEILKLLAGGAWMEAGSQKWKGLDISSGKDENAAGRALINTLATLPGSWQEDGKDYVAADFGFLREFAKRATIQEWSPNTPLLFDGGPNHPHGPLLTAYSQVLAAYRNAAPKYEAFMARPVPSVTLPSSSELDAIIAKVTTNTSVWGDEGEWTWFEGLFEKDKLLADILSAAVVTIAPVSASHSATGDASSASVSITGLTAGTLTVPSMGTEWASAVAVSDLVDDAVEAFDALDDIRFAAQLSSVQASFAGARAVMTSTFDDAMVLANAEKAARSAAYDKDLRAAFVKDTVAAEIDHRHTTLDQRGQQGQLNVATFQANEESKSRAASIAVQIGDIQARISMANADATNRMLLANAEGADRVSITNAELGTRAAIAGREIPAGIASGIMSSAVSWMHARAIPVTNAGAIAGVISTMYDAKLKQGIASAEIGSKHYLDTFAGLGSWATGWNATGQAGWNSLTSSMELYRAAIATASGVPGTVHRDSTFTVATQLIAGGLGAAAGIANIVMALS